MRFGYIKVVTILFLFTLSACHQTARNTNRVNRLSATGNVIKIRDVDLDREFSWNDKLDSITIIPLENSAQAMIGRVTKAEVHNGRLIFLDMLNRRLLVFDALTGAFISSIGARGKGPGEYTEPRDFTIVGDTIFVLDYLDVKKYSMLDYHYLGNYKISQELIGEINPVQFLFYGDNQFYLWNNGKHQIDKHVGVYDLNFYKNGKLDKVYGLNDRHIKSFDENRFFHTYKGFYLVAPPAGQYGIAKIDRDKVNSFVKLDFGNDSVSSLHDKIQQNLFKAFSARV